MKQWMSFILNIGVDWKIEDDQEIVWNEVETALGERERARNPVRVLSMARF